MSTDPARCDYSWLYERECAHCLDHHLDPAVAAAWDYN